MNYTKGEWKAGNVDVVTKSTHIANCYSESNFKRPSIGEALVNAHLISAAPDMYEALKLYQSHQEGTSGHYCWKCAEAINKALAKAEGK